jgi:hypothetical protein
MWKSSKRFNCYVLLSLDGPYQRAYRLALNYLIIQKLKTVLLPIVLR